MSKLDRTFAAEAAYGSEKWCAATIGVGYDSWRKYRRRALESDGFPKRDALVGLTLKADVMAWLASRHSASKVK